MCRPIDNDEIRAPSRASKSPGSVQMRWPPDLFGESRGHARLMIRNADDLHIVRQPKRTQVHARHANVPPRSLLRASGLPPLYVATPSPGPFPSELAEGELSVASALFIRLMPTAGGKVRRIGGGVTARETAPIPRFVTRRLVLKYHCLVFYRHLGTSQRLSDQTRKGCFFDVYIVCLHPRSWTGKTVRPLIVYQIPSHARGSAESRPRASTRSRPVHRTPPRPVSSPRQSGALWCGQRLRKA